MWGGAEGFASNTVRFFELGSQHKETIEEMPVDMNVTAMLSEESASSVARQSEIEANDSVDFEAFMRQYRTRNSLS